MEKNDLNRHLTREDIKMEIKYVNTEIRLIVFFAVKDGEALYNQYKQDSSWLWLMSWNPYCQIQT